MMRLRITFSKTEAMRYTGHLDLHRTWERTFRRARLPLAYSQGFHPQPRLNLACALPLGFTSHCELIDAWLEHELLLDVIKQALEHSIPPGIIIHQIETVDSQLPSLQSQVISAEYAILILEPIPDLSELVTRILSSESLPRQRRNKLYDLRPLIESMHLNHESKTNLPLLIIQMAAREGATGRPEEVLAEMAISYENTRIDRTRLILRENHG